MKLTRWLRRHKILTALGLVLAAAAVAAFQFFEEVTIDRLHSTVPLLEELDVPMLWIFGGEDSSLPTPASIAALEEVKAKHGTPIDVVLFPEAEHGILRFEEVDGERELLGFEPGYYATLVDWLERQNGLEPRVRRGSAG